MKVTFKIYSNTFQKRIICHIVTQFSEFTSITTKGSVTNGGIKETVFEGEIGLDDHLTEEMLGIAGANVCKLRTLRNSSQ